jgi:uncharacterized protein (DUF4415 family)
MSVARKKMKEINSPDEIPEFETEREEAEFWSTHALSEEFFEKAEPIPEGVLPPPRPRTKPISLRFDKDVLERLKTMAKLKHKGYQTMLKEFVLERLYEEEKREGLLQESERPEDQGPRWPGRPGEGWDKTYRRLLVGSEGKWTDDPLSNIGSLIVVKAAASALGMDYREFGAWVRQTPEEEVRAKLSEEEIARKFRRELDRFGKSASEDLELVKPTE